MPKLNTANNVKRGTTQVERVYAGPTLIWQYPIPVSVNLSATSNQIDNGQSTTLIADIVPTKVSPVPVWGTVRFRTGSVTGTIVATVTAPPYRATVSPMIDTTYYATYEGGHPYVAKNSVGLGVNVAGDVTVNLTSDKTTVAQGVSVVLSVTVPGITTGTVRFRTGSTTGPIATTVTGTSPWQYIVTPTADVTYYAEFVGTTEYKTAFSAGRALDFYIPTATTLTSSKTTINAGESITLSATVPGVAVGTMNFRSGSSAGPIVATDNTAPWSVSVVPSTGTTYFAEYLGSGDYAPSVSTGVAIAYTAPTSTSLAIDKASVATGGTVTLTATVTGATTGTVNFHRSSDNSVVATDTSSPWTYTFTPAADVSIYAKYVANGDYQGSTSNTVTSDFYIPTSTDLSGQTTVNNGTATTISATVSASATGYVDFRTWGTDGAIIGTVNGPPWNLSVAPGGSTAYYATYRGSGNFAASASGGISVWVRQLVTHTWSGYATWYQCYNGSGNQKSGDMYYGYYSSNNGNQRSMYGFDMPDFRNVVAVTGVRIKYYNNHHFNNSGGDIPVGLHESASKPTNYCCSYERLQTLDNAPKPGWVDNWMNGNFTARVKASLIKGFTLGPGVDNSQSYYGSGTGDSPYMEVSYQVWE